MENYADLMFIDAVADLQREEGTFDKYQTAYRHRTSETLGEKEIGFIAARDSFYIASMNAQGWPYIQHRGGPRGFLQYIGENRLACADYPGNRQFITMGNLQSEERVSLFFMDYLNQARLKIQGKATLISAADADPELVKKLSVPEVETQRVLQIEVISLDWNCPKYIPMMFSKPHVQTILADQLGKLQEENAALREELETLRQSAG